MDEAYRAAGVLETIPPDLEDTGEVNWLIGDATRIAVAVPALKVSVMRFFTSRDAKRYAARSFAMMRHTFGGTHTGTTTPSCASVAKVASATTFQVPRRRGLSQARRTESCLGEARQERSPDAHRWEGALGEPGCPRPHACPYH